LMGWGRLAEKGVTVIDTVADHLTILNQPAVRHLAVNLRQLIDDSENLQRRLPAPAR